MLVLKALGISFNEVVLDDVEDDRSPGVIARWEQAGLATRVIETPTGRHLTGVCP